MNKQNIIKEHYKSIGIKGGKKRWEGIDLEERKRQMTELSKKAAEARKKGG